MEEFEQKVELEEDHERRLRRLKKASTQKPTRATYVPPSQRRVRNTFNLNGFEF